MRKVELLVRDGWRLCDSFDVNLSPTKKTTFMDSPTFIHSSLSRLLSSPAPRRIHSLLSRLLSSHSSLPQSQSRYSLIFHYKSRCKCFRRGNDLQLHVIVVTIILCLLVFGRVKMINKVATTFLLPVLFSLFCIFIGSSVTPIRDALSNGTGLSLSTFKDIWSSNHQRTNNAAILDPEGSNYGNFN